MKRVFRPPIFRNGRCSLLKALVEQNVYAFQGSGYSCGLGSVGESSGRLGSVPTYIFTCDSRHNREKSWNTVEILSVTEETENLASL